MKTRAHWGVKKSSGVARRTDLILVMSVLAPLAEAEAEEADTEAKLCTRGHWENALQTNFGRLLEQRAKVRCEVAAAGASAGPTGALEWGGLRRVDPAKVKLLKPCAQHRLIFVDKIPEERV